MKTQLAKIATVNVIEQIENVPTTLRSFADTPSGNKQAEAVFKAMVKAYDHSLTEEEIQEILDATYYDPAEDYELFITHSDMGNEHIELS